MTDRLLFSADEPRRFYLVPRERLDREALDPLPPGDLALRTVDGASYDLSEADLAVFEVDRERAIAHVDAGVERMLGPLLDWFERDSVRVFGVTAGEALIDREKRREARRSFLEQAGRLVRPDLSDEDIAAAEHQLDELGGTLSREGKRLTERLEEQLPALEAAVATAERRALALGQQMLDAFRGLARPAAHDDADRDAERDRED